MTSTAIRHNKHVNGIKNVTREEPTCWCKGAYASYLTDHGFKISNSIMCRRPPNECFGSHTAKIKTKEFIKDWASKDKTNFDILKLEQDIISMAKQLKDRVNCKELSIAIGKLDSMLFEDIITFWHDFECHYGAIYKKLPWKSQGNSDKTEESYHYKEDVPRIILSNFKEDDIWAFERTLHICDSHFDVMDNKDSTHSIDKICIGGTCCKWGVHNLSEFVCIMNMKEGECDCQSLESINSIKTTNNNMISLLEKQMNSTVDADGFKIKITPAIKKSIGDKIHLLELENSKLYRKVHYTEQGMIPYRIRLNEMKKTAPVVDLHKIEVKKVIAVTKKIYVKT